MGDNEGIQTMTVFEEMKMLNSLQAEKKFRVKKIKPQAGDAFILDAVIMELEG